MHSIQSRDARSVSPCDNAGWKAISSRCFLLGDSGLGIRIGFQFRGIKYHRLGASHIVLVLTLPQRKADKGDLRERTNRAPRRTR